MQYTGFINIINFIQMQKNINKIKIMVPLIMVCLLLASCKKEGVKVFEGEYTYKTSGNVVVTINGTNIPVSLINHTGQLDIIDIGEDDKVQIVKTSLEGNVSTYNATINDDEIGFDPTTFSEIIVLGTSGAYGTGIITSKATGKIYNKNTIIINEVYQGTYIGSDSLHTMGTIYGDNVLTVADRNED